MLVQFTVGSGSRSSVEDCAEGKSEARFAMTRPFQHETRLRSAIPERVVCGQQEERDPQLALALALALAMQAGPFPTEPSAGRR